MWAQNLFSITLFLTGFMLGSLSSEKRYSEVKVRKYLMDNVGVKFSDEILNLLLMYIVKVLLFFILTLSYTYFINDF